MEPPLSGCELGHLMVGNRADSKRFLGEGWAVNTSTGNSALLAGTCSFLELVSF